MHGDGHSPCSQAFVACSRRRRAHCLRPSIMPPTVITRQMPVTYSQPSSHASGMQNSPFANANNTQTSSSAAYQQYGRPPMPSSSQSLQQSQSGGRAGASVPSSAASSTPTPTPPLSHHSHHAYPIHTPNVQQHKPQYAHHHQQQYHSAPQPQYHAQYSHSYQPAHSPSVRSEPFSPLSPLTPTVPSETSTLSAEVESLKREIAQLTANRDENIRALIAAQKTIRQSKAPNSQNTSPTLSSSSPTSNIPTSPSQATKSDITALINFIAPTHAGESQRHHILAYVKAIIRKSLGAQVYPHGSYALKTYLPNSAMSVTAFFSRAHELTWVQRIINALCTEANAATFTAQPTQHSSSSSPTSLAGSSSAPSSTVSPVKHTIESITVQMNGRIQSSVVSCVIDNMRCSIHGNAVNTLGALALFERADILIGQNHLFKRSVLLMKAYVQRHQLNDETVGQGVTGNMIRTMMLFIFNAYHTDITTPLDALTSLLVYLQHFDWDEWALTIFGPIYVKSIDSGRLEPVSTASVCCWPANRQPLMSRAIVKQYAVHSRKSIAAGGMTTSVSNNALGSGNATPTQSAQTMRRVHSAAFMSSDLQESPTRSNSETNLAALSYRSFSSSTLSSMGALTSPPRAVIARRNTPPPMAQAAASESTDFAANTNKPHSHSQANLNALELPDRHGARSRSLTSLSSLDHAQTHLQQQSSFASSSSLRSSQSDLLLNEDDDHDDDDDADDVDNDDELAYLDTTYSSELLHNDDDNTDFVDAFLPATSPSSKIATFKTAIHVLDPLEHTKNLAHKVAAKYETVIRHVLSEGLTRLHIAMSDQQSGPQETNGALMELFDEKTLSDYAASLKKPATASGSPGEAASATASSPLAHIPSVTSIASSYSISPSPVMDNVIPKSSSFTSGYTSSSDIDSHSYSSGSLHTLSYSAAMNNPSSIFGPPSQPVVDDGWSHTPRTQSLVATSMSAHSSLSSSPSSSMFTTQNASQFSQPLRSSNTGTTSPSFTSVIGSTKSMNGTFNPNSSVFVPGQPISRASATSTTIINDTQQQMESSSSSLSSLVSPKQQQQGISTSPAEYDRFDGHFDKIVQNLTHARQFETPDISENELIQLVKDILQERGSVPVGRMGSLLHDATNNHSLPAMLKENFGGLKRLLERHPRTFIVGKDHPYNPHVRLRQQLTPANPAGVNAQGTRRKVQRRRTRIRRVPNRSGGQSPPQHGQQPTQQPPPHMLNSMAPHQHMQQMSLSGSSVVNSPPSRPPLTTCLVLNCELISGRAHRVTVLNFHGEIVYDTIILPLDRNVSVEHDDDEMDVTDFPTAHRDVSALIKGRIIIGHLLQPQLAALSLSQPKQQLRDTALCRLLCPQRPLSLRRLCLDRIGVDMSREKSSATYSPNTNALILQASDSSGDSLEDCRAALALYKTVAIQYEALLGQNANITINID